MNLWLAVFVILAISAATIAVMLAVRGLLAPRGGFFTDLTTNGGRCATAIRARASENKSGSIRPTALTRSLTVMEHERPWLAMGGNAPCGPSGEPT